MTTNTPEELTIEQRQDDQLWSLHVLGPDDVYPAPDRATAQLWAAQWTVWNHRRNPNPTKFQPVMSWIVRPWPYDGESHAAGLADSIAENTWPVDPLSHMPRIPEDVREAVARKLCEQHGGDPDALAVEEHDSWDGPLWTAFTRDADAILTLLHQPEQGREGQQFGRSDMLGYGYAGYCAGWKAAISVVMEPGKGDATHGQVWLRDNPPKQMDEPLFRTLLPAAPVDGEPNAR